MDLSEAQHGFLFSATPAAARAERKRGKRPKRARRYASLETAATIG